MTHTSLQTSGSCDTKHVADGASGRLPATSVLHSGPTQQETVASLSNDGQRWWQHTNALLQNTVVMIIDPQLPHAHWPIRKVLKLNASADGRIRSAKVQVGGKNYL